MKALVTVDVEGVPSQGSYESVDRFDDIIEKSEIPFTLFVTPQVVRNRPKIIQKWFAADHTIGLHIHPGRMPGGTSDWLTEYNTEEIGRFISDGVAVFESELGITPTVFRAGRWEFSDPLLAALASADFDRDASLKSGESTLPFERHSVQEFPLTVYSNPIVRIAMIPWTYSFIPMHLDAFLQNRLMRAMFYLVTRRLLRSDRPYLMVSYHDYDINSSTMVDRILAFQRYLQTRASMVTLDELPFREYA